MSRVGKSFRALPTMSARATAEDTLQVCLCIGDTVGDGEFTRYLTAAQARAIGAALIGAADFYASETARVASEEQAA